jgi:hypothetical protein
MIAGPFGPGDHRCPSEGNVFRANVWDTSVPDGLF